MRDATLPRRGAAGDAATAAAKPVQTARKPPVWLGCSPAAPHENERMEGRAEYMGPRPASLYVGQRLVKRAESRAITPLLMKNQARCFS